MKILNKKDLLVRANGLAYKKYAKGPFTGTAVSFHNNSQLKSRQGYKYGLPNGSYEVYFENGKLREKGEYSLIWDPYIGVVWYESWEGVQETRENGYLIYTSAYGAAELNQYEIFKDGKPFDCFVVEREDSQYCVGRYKGRWVGEPIPEFIVGQEIRYCPVRKKDVLQNLREGVWEWFSVLGSSFDSNKHGSEIWHELSCTAWLFGKVYIKNEFREGEYIWNVHNRRFFKDGQSCRSEYFDDCEETFDADGNLIESRKYKSIDVDDDL